jgi:hypothetical protein
MAARRERSEQVLLSKIIIMMMMMRAKSKGKRRKDEKFTNALMADGDVFASFVVILGLNGVCVCVSRHESYI